MKYLALLRGINVGGNNKVDMAKLCEVFEGLGFQDVSTYINSGNVIFDSSKKVSTKKIETAIEQKFGFDVRVVVRGKASIAKIQKKIPKNWENNKEQKTDVLFLWDDYADKSTLKLIKTTDVDTLLYVDGAIIWHLKKSDYNKSGMNKFIGTEVYKNMTARNVNTVRKLWDLLK